MSMPPADTIDPTSLPIVGQAGAPMPNRRLLTVTTIPPTFAAFLVS
jgi:hypothetical protein